ncbi:arginyl-tRNA synthetase, class Ic [Artemisia annua]|uniref:arginine--tRNA ligase n=1 Tax=Artemisia annua TaxID=35608 RepID=A0A2U1NV33_ARTAN|nr:arginyl-tRNA synthetase, class Ic [Artemisia annua]
MDSCTSTTVKPFTSSVKPSTPIPEAFEWIRAVSTVKEREKVLAWARSKAYEMDLTDPNESMRLLMWAEFLFTAIVQYPEPEERKRLLKWAHSTARVAAPDASELKLEKDKGWEKGEERILGFHLLEFTEALEESCLFVLPHILCEYVYDLSKKFNEYHSSVCKDGFVAETSTLLLYEATAVVIEQCFNLLGIDPV